MGTTEDEAFFVKCDRTTMTQDDIDNGRLICLDRRGPGQARGVRDLPHRPADRRGQTIRFVIDAVVGFKPRMVHISRFALALCLLTWLMPIASAAQSGSIVGRVVDQTGAGLPGVTIELTTPNGETTAISDTRGEFRFDAVRSGSAELTFRLINFTVLRRTAAVRDGEVSMVDAMLQLSLRADVVVTGTSTFRNIADIENPAENLVGIAAAASQGAITAAQLEARPIMRAGEVLETVPGMIVSQHSGEGKANQYYLRGFNLDHGTDFSTTVAGVPVNTPTGAHAHGYADVELSDSGAGQRRAVQEGPVLRRRGGLLRRRRRQHQLRQSARSSARAS